VAGRVDDIDPDTIPEDRAVFGRNSDTALFFQVQGVHQPFVNLLVGPEQTALSEHGIHQSGLAVVNVGDDGDVSQAVVCLYVRHRSNFSLPYPFPSPAGRSNITIGVSITRLFGNIESVKLVLTAPQEPTDRQGERLVGHFTFFEGKSD